MTKGGRKGTLVGVEKGVEWDPSGIGVGSGSVFGFYR